MASSGVLGAVTSAAAPVAELVWTATQMRTGTRVVVNAELIAAYQAASSPHSIRALKSDLEAFDLWCRRTNRIALPASPEIVADYLDARAGQGARPASLGRYKASFAKIHQLLDLKHPTQAELVKLRLRAIRRQKGVAQAQARPLRFKGPVRDIERDKPRGIDVSRLLKGVSAHSTRVRLNQDLFASGEDLAGIMGALRWKSPRMPLAYNRNLAAEQGATGHLMNKLA